MPRAKAKASRVPRWPGSDSNTWRPARPACSPAVSSSAWRWPALWALEPELLILDEPTASLDPASSREVERIIGEIAAAGARILMTTHNLGQAKRLAEDIVFIDRGRIVEQTAVAQFFTLPQTEAAQRFLQEETP
jgi:ABC-type histidine transport system ATPase subunit